MTRSQIENLLPAVFGRLHATISTILNEHVVQEDNKGEDEQIEK
jgi:hypothetical protein